MKEKDSNALPGECPYHACGNTCGGQGFYIYGGATIYCWVGKPATDIEDSDIGVAVERMEKFIDLEKEFRTVMMTVVAGRADNRLFELLVELETNYQWLLDATHPGDRFVNSNRTVIRQRIADIGDWRARAFEMSRRFNDAITEFDRAAGLYEQMGSKKEAQRSRDKANDLRLLTTGDFDADFERMRVSLENAAPGTLTRVQVLIALGELHSQANDDFQAVRFLHEAERELGDLGGHAGRGELLAALVDTAIRIEKGEQVAGASSIETGVLRRALTQRLLLALGNAYRTTDPTRAAEYEEQLRRIDDDGSDSNTQDLLGKFLDAGQDIGKFLQGLEKKQ